MNAEAEEKPSSCAIIFSGVLGDMDLQRSIRARLMYSSTEQFAFLRNSRMKLERLHPAICAKRSMLQLRPHCRSMYSLARATVS